MAIERVLSQLRFLVVREWDMRVPSISYEWAGGGMVDHENGQNWE